MSRQLMMVHNIAIVWSIIVPLGLLPLGCLSFHIIQPHVTSKSSTSSSSCLYSTKSSADTEYVSPFNLGEFSNDSSLSNNDNNAVEIWLDLRETTLSPSTALELWDLECTDSDYNKYSKDCPNTYFNARNGYIKVCSTWLMRLWAVQVDSKTGN